MAEDHCANREDGFAHPNNDGGFFSEVIGVGLSSRDNRNVIIRFHTDSRPLANQSETVQS
jgi:hypothetical protein